MNMLRALQVLKEDIKNKNNYSKLHLDSDIFEFYGPIPKYRLIHFFGHPDCGKTTIAKDLVRNNTSKSFVYISNSLDDIKSIKNYDNCTVMISNVFEKTLDFLKSLNPGLVDVVILDNINNMLSKEELDAAFTKRLNNAEILNKYIKQLSILAVQKKFNIIIFNGINLITNKSRYSYIIDKESVASFEIKKKSCTLDRLSCDIIPIKNLMDDNKSVYDYEFYWRESRRRLRF